VSYEYDALGGIFMKPDIYFGIFLFILILIIGAFNYLENKQSNKSPVPYVQKFRFSEQCPDGLRVEYVSTIRLSKSMLCQKAVGE